MKSERDNVVNVKARCAHDLAIFHHVKPTRRILAAALKQYLFPVTIAKSGANACTKCPIVTIRYSIPTSFYSQSHLARNYVQAIFRNGSYRRFRHQVHCRRVRSFLAILFYCSLRRNSSRYALDRLAAI